MGARIHPHTNTRKKCMKLYEISGAEEELEKVGGYII